MSPFRGGGHWWGDVTSCVDRKVGHKVYYLYCLQTFKVKPVQVHTKPNFKLVGATEECKGLK